MEPKVWLSLEQSNKHPPTHGAIINTFQASQFTCVRACACAHTHTHTHTQNGCNRTPPTQPAPVNLALDSTPLETSHSQVTHLSLTPSVQISSYSCQEFIQIRLEGMSSLQGSPFQIVGLPANPSFLKGRGNLSHVGILVPSFGSIERRMQSSTLPHMQCCQSSCNH